MAEGRVLIDQVNMGYWLVDCSVCGTIGVWPRKTEALLAKKAHQCPQSGGTFHGGNDRLCSRHAACRLGDDGGTVEPKGICPNCNRPIIDHDSSQRKHCHDAVSGYQRPGLDNTREVV